MRYLTNSVVHLTETRKGEFFALSNILVGALGPVAFILSARELPALYAASFGTLIASLIFGILAYARGTLRDLKNRAVWRPLIASTILIAVCCHTLILVGYAHTTAGNASIVSLIEVLFSFIFFGFILRKETYTPHAFIGAGLMIFGVAVVLIQKSGAIRIGDLLIIAGLLFAPAGNYFQQQTRKLIAAEVLLFSRSLIGGLTMLAIGIATTSFPKTVTITHALPILLINGVLMMSVAKIIWIETIHRIPVAKALTLQTFTPACTFIIAFPLLREVPSWWQIIGFVPMAAGAYLILNKDFLHPASAPEAIR